MKEKNIHAFGDIKSHFRPNYLFSTLILFNFIFFKDLDNIP